MKVTASSPQGIAMEKVEVHVLPANPTSGIIPGQKNQQDLQVVDSGRASGTGASGTSSKEPPSAGQGGGSIAIISIVVVVGIVPMVVVLSWCWHKHRRLAPAHSKVRWWWHLILLYL